MHFNRAIGLGYHSIPKINWGSFRVDVKRNGDYFGVDLRIISVLTIISGAVQLPLIYPPLQLPRRIFHIGENCNPRWLPVYLADI